MAMVCVCVFLLTVDALIMSMNPTETNISCPLAASCNRRNELPTPHWPPLDQSKSLCHGVPCSTHQKPDPKIITSKTLPCGYGSKSWHSGCSTQISGAKLLSSEHGSAWRALPRTQPPRPAQPLWPGLRKPWRLWKSSSRLARLAALAAQGARVKQRPWPQLVRRKRPCNWWTWAKLVFGMGNLLGMVSWSS